MAVTMCMWAYEPPENDNSLLGLAKRPCERGPSPERDRPPVNTSKSRREAELLTIREDLVTLRNGILDSNDARKTLYRTDHLIDQIDNLLAER